MVVGSLTTDLHYISMFTTHDGGQSWTSLPIPGGSMMDPLLSCPTTLNCVEMEIPLPVVNQGGPGSIGGKFDENITLDGGHSWITKPLPGSFMPATLQCTTGSHCISTGVEPTAAQEANPGDLEGWAAAIYSIDGGLTWTSSPAPPAAEIEHLSCALSNYTYWGVYSKAGPQVLNEYFALITDDGGETWTSEPLPTEQGLKPWDIDAVSCPTASDCRVSGLVSLGNGSAGSTSAQGIILATTDDGQTWTSEPLPTVQSMALGDVDEVACPTADNCYALASEQPTFSNPPQAPKQVFLSNR
jgi:photosystem II stability/assembly factor-like uncharacterized protein